MFKAEDQPGTVSLFSARPRVGTVVSAALTDPDGLEGGGSGPAASLGAVSWSWARSSDGTIWTGVVAYGDGDSYVPTEEDEGMLLKAEASYTDGHGSGKSAQAVSSGVVGARESGPEFTVTEIVTGLSHPWGIDFTPDGTMLFTQRAGVLNARLTDGTVKRVDADLGDLLVDGFAGLQALAVDPDFSTNRRFYTLQGHTGREMQGDRLDDRRGLRRSRSCRRSPGEGHSDWGPAPGTREAGWCSVQRDIYGSRPATGGW